MPRVSPAFSRCMAPVRLPARRTPSSKTPSRVGRCDRNRRFPPPEQGNLNELSGKMPKRCAVCFPQPEQFLAGGQVGDGDDLAPKRQIERAVASGAGHGFFFNRHPSLLTCGVREMANESGGTSTVTVVPAATRELRPTLTGATNCTSLPMNTSSPITVRCL